MNTKQEYNKELKGIVKNAGFGSIGIIFSTVIRFVNNILMTQYLGASLYGLYVLVNHIFRLISNIGQLGISKTTMRFISFFKGQKEHGKIKGTFLFCFKLVFIASIILLISTLLLAPEILEKVYEKPEIKEILTILIFALPATLAMTVVVASLQGLKFIKQYVIITKMLMPLSFTIILLITFTLGYKLKGVVYGQLINVLLFAVIASFILYRKYFKSKKKIKPVIEKKELLKFAFPLYLNSFILFFSKSFPIFFIAFLLTNKEIGIYNICIKLTQLSGFASSAFAIIFLPVISNQFGKGNTKLIEQLYKTITKWQFTFTLLTTFILYIYYEPILGLFGKEFTEGKIVLFIVITAQLLANLTGVAGNILIMSGRSKIVLANSILMLILTVLSSLILIPPYGIIGAAIAYSTSIVVINFIKLIELYYFEKMHPFDYKYIKPVVASLISFGIMFIFNYFIDIEVFFQTVVGSFILFLSFVILIWLFKLNEEDKYIYDFILQKFKKRGK